MRPLTAEEIPRARETAHRLWHRVWFIQFLGFLPLICFSVLVLWPETGFQLWEVFVSLLAFVLAPAMSFPVVWWGYRRWVGDFEADVVEGQAEQKTGKVYDRFRWRSLLRPRTHVVWAEGIDLPIGLCIDERKFGTIHVSDHIGVDYLPRTGIVLEVRKLTPSR